MARQAKKPSTEASAKTPSDPTTKAKIAETNTVSVKIPVVGLGASAGGVQAFTDFFEALPDKTGMAFVAIHHVDPDHKNLMADLLAKHSKMNVALAQEGTPIAPDHVYIIPPKRFFSIEKGARRLTEPTERRRMRLPSFYLGQVGMAQQEYAASRKVVV